MRDAAWSDPPLSQKAAIAASSFGWLVAAMLSAGTVVWCREVRRVVRGH